MLKFRCLLALSLVLATSIGAARAASIRDNAGLFDPDAVRQAQAKLDQIERDSGINTTIETIESLEGESIDSATIRHARDSGLQGIYILIPKQDHKIEVEVSRAYQNALPRTRRLAIRDAFISGFKRGDFDGGLKQGVREIENQVSEAKAALGGTLRAPAAAPPLRGHPVAQPQRQSFGLGSLLMIGLLIIVVLIGIRALGRLFGGGARGYAGPPRMGGPGYGAPGYGGGGGGGFMSSLFGGIGGALAGNWLYDQFSGRHHGGGYADNASYGADAASPSSGADAGGPDWAGSGEAGDWGGGDAGGGGDWGGGGGGGDWGGGGDGGGGGDW